MLPVEGRKEGQDRGRGLRENTMYKIYKQQGYIIQQGNIAIIL